MLVFCMALVDTHSIKPLGFCHVAWHLFGHEVVRRPFRQGLGSTVEAATRLLPRAQKKRERVKGGDFLAGREDLPSGKLT